MIKLPCDVSDNAAVKSLQVKETKGEREIKKFQNINICISFYSCQMTTDKKESHTK